MNRIFAITSIFLFIAPSVPTLSGAEFSKEPTGNERPHVQLARDWTRSPPADRADCLRLTGSTGAYTDLLRCLEIKRDARQHPKVPDEPTTVN
jgi:hypothetical protein